MLTRMRTFIWDATTRIVSDSIALVSPDKAQRYRFQRELYKLRNILFDERKYVAALSAGPWQLWNPPTSSGNREVQAARVKVTNRVRDQERNNPLVRGIIYKNATLTIGDDIRMKSLVELDDGTPATAARKAIQKRFARWAKAVTPEGLSLTEVMQFVENHRLLDGEILQRDLMIKPPAGTIANPYRIQLLESDHLVANKASYGIEYSDLGEPLAFWIYPKHPAGIEPPGEPFRVPASEMTILFESNRISQTRGISPLAAAIMGLYGVDSLEDAELIAARSAASFGLIVTTDLPPEVMWDEFGGLQDMLNKPLQYEGAGAVFQANPGQKVESFSSNRPNSNFEPFVRGRERRAITSTGMSYETGSGNFENVNFSSAMMARNIEWATIRRRQKADAKLCNRVFSKWLFNEIMLVGIPEIPASVYVADPTRFEACSWQFSGNPAVDPLKIVNAAALEVHLGVKSRQQYCAEQGRELSETLQQLAEEKVVMKELDIYQEDPRAELFGAIVADEQEGEE